MIRKIFGLVTLCFATQMITAQVILNANGPGNTYELCELKLLRLKYISYIGKPIW